MQLRANRVTLFLVLLFSSSVQALELRQSFENLSEKESSTLVWNSELGELHPPLFVKGYFDTALANRNFDIGDGSHGPFELNTYSNFSSNIDSVNKIIYLDTEQFTELRVTRFELAAGWTLRPVGENPLIIRSLTNIVVYGSVNCSGENGASIASPNSVVRRGGLAHCGSGAGGNGGTVSSTAQAGSNGGDIITDGVAPGTDGPTAGGAGAHAGNGVGGGGGGAYQEFGIGFTDPSAGAGVGGGSVGEMAPDHSFTYEGGGFGGGGGDYSADSAGGGGGAGGGMIFMFAQGYIDVHLGGQVLADGGNGGGGDGNGGTSLLTAGGGGGGGGGSILMFAGKDVRLAGTVRAEAGLGGDDDGEAGGRGADGRTWLVGSSGFSQSLGADPFILEHPDYQLGAVGAVRYRTDTEFEAISKSFDLLNTKPDVTALHKDSDQPGASQVIVEWSSGNYASFTPVQWNSASTPLTGERYLRYRVRIDNQDEVTPAKIRSMSLFYTPYSQEEFEFAGGCGLVKSEGPLDFGSILGLMFILLAPIAYWGWFRFRSSISL